MDFVDAVMHLCCDTPPNMQLNETLENNQSDNRVRSFRLPVAYKNNDKVIPYLERRGISIFIIDYCIDNKLNRESADYHNAVFVGYDEENTPRYAALRGTWQDIINSFKVEVAGSDKRFYFSVTPKEKCDKLIVSESIIDVLSVATLWNKIRNAHYLSIGGAYAPKTSNTKLSKALSTYLTALWKYKGN